MPLSHMSPAGASRGRGMSGWCAGLRAATARPLTASSTGQPELVVSASNGKAPTLIFKMSGRPLTYHQLPSLQKV